MTLKESWLSQQKWLSDRPEARSDQDAYYVGAGISASHALGSQKVSSIRSQLHCRDARSSRCRIGSMGSCARGRSQSET